MENVSPHSKIKIGENGVDIEREKFRRQVLASFTWPQIWSFHVVVTARTAKKWIKMQNARAGRAELLFLLIKPVILWRSRRRLRRLCLSFLVAQWLQHPTSRSRSSDFFWVSILVQKLVMLLDRLLLVTTRIFRICVLSWCLIQFMRCFSP